MKLIHQLFVGIALVSLAACVENKESAPAEPAGEVNVYSHRHYETDEKLFAQFEEQTGIKVNVVAFRRIS